jgi:HD-like signal output (HDOD) protein
MILEKDITLEITKIKNLPPLPEESMRIISAVNDPDISIQALVNVIYLSPTLSARLLGLANSAYFGRTVEITDLRTAIIQVLGVNLVKSFALSLALSAELDTSKCKLFDADFFWSHALVTALIAQKLAVQLNDEQLEPNTVYSTGLLLNIGLLAAVCIVPEELDLVFASTDRIKGSVSTRMLKVFGQTQYKMGGMLFERWQLPKKYQTIVKKFQQPEYNGKEKRLILLLELCHWVSVYIVTDKHEQMPDFSDLLNRVSLSAELLATTVAEVVTSKDNIKDLASVISG